MDCKTARKIYVKGADTPDGFVKQLRKFFPELVNFFDAQVESFIKKETNPFHEKVKELSGVKEHFHTVHLEDDSFLTHILHDVLGDAAARFFLDTYYTEKSGQEVKFGALCCSACSIFPGMSPAQSVRIQFAAVRVEPDGTVI